MKDKVTEKMDKKAIWINANGEKIFVEILDELRPLNMPKKFRVRKEYGSGTFLLNIDKVMFVEKCKCDRQGLSKNSPCHVCGGSGWKLVRRKK